MTNLWSNRWVCGVTLALLVAMPMAAVANDVEEQKAVEVASEWLAVVDGGEFGKSWDAAAELFRNAVPREKWEGMAAAARTPLGALVSRELKSATYSTSLPGAPDGEYVMIQFDTVFENKASAVETITPMKDADGEWRVSGYFIK